MRARKILWGVFTSALLATAPQAAGATPVCGGSSFATCASVTITKTLLSNGNVRVRIEVMNQAGLGNTYEGSTFTRIGLWGLPERARYVDGSLFVGGSGIATDWRLAHRTADDEGDESMRTDMRGVRLRPGINGGLRAGQSAAFEFDLSGVPIDSVNIRDWAIHAEVAGGACSTDMVARNGTLSEARNEAALCVARRQIRRHLRHDDGPLDWMASCVMGDMAGTCDRGRGSMTLRPSWRASPNW